MYAAPSIAIPCLFGETIDLIGAGDLHWSSAESDHGLWWDMFKRNPNAYYFFTGDLLHMIAMDDKRWGGELKPEFYSFRDLRKLADAEVQSFCLQIQKRLGQSWIKKHVLGALSGNHPNKPADLGWGHDPHERMCDILGIRNLGYSCFLPLDLRPKGKTGRRTIMVYAHHGFGGGSRTIGYNATKFGNHAWQYDADICLYGHSHDKFVKKLVNIEYVPADPPRIRSQQRVLANCGTFQRTLSQGPVPAYGEQKGYPVRDLGWVTVHITPERKIVKKPPVYENGKKKRRQGDEFNVHITVEE